MDPSIRLSYLLGALEVEPGEITSDEWVTVLNTILKKCTPQLKYFAGFEEISKLLNSVFYEGRLNRHKRTVQTDLHLVKFGSDFTEKTRFIVIRELKCEDEKTKHGDFRIRDTLLITQRGDWVKWSAVYNITSECGLGIKGENSWEKELALSSEFSVLDDIGLKKVIEGLDKYWVDRILIRIFEIIQETVEEKQKRLQSSQQLLKEILEITRRCTSEVGR